MATEVLTDCKIYFEELDLSGQENQIALTHEGEPLDETTFGQTTRKARGGLLNLGCVGSGFVDLTAGGIDERVFGEVNLPGEIMSLVPQGESEGNIGYMFQPILNRYDYELEVGTIFAFELEATNRGAKLIRSTMLGQELAAVASGGSTSRQLGAVSAAQVVYAGIHVLSVSGTNPTLDVVVRSDDNSGMTTPTTRITFTQATDVTSQFLSAVGAIADEWWDIDFTIGGTDTPTFRFVVLVGIA